jgi:DNA-binding SARP family transcriptional activator/predicted ATPase
MLGPLEVRDGEGETVALPRRQQRALLAALLIRVGEVVSTDRLIDDLWDESPPPAAKGALQNTVWQLRKLIGAELLRTQPPGYVLDVDPDSVDARRFRRLLAEAGRPPAERAAVLREALALWYGPALADLLSYRWAEVEAARLEEEKLVTIEERIEAELELRQHAALVAQLDALTAEHPRRERLWRQRALALYRCGRQNEALAAIREVAARLGEEALDPTPELRQLERDILNQSPSIDPPALVEVADELPEARGERRVVSVVSVALADEDDPELLRAALDRLLKTANEAVPAHGGELEAFGPEGLTAVFGADSAHEDDALRAVRVARAIHEATGNSAGIATAEALIGERPRVAGPAVARAAGLARLGGGVLADPRTYELVRNAVTAESFGLVWCVVSVSAARPESALETPLVGRAEELELLRARFTTAVEERRCVAATVVGEPGIGKTRLARELAAGLDAAVLVGRCAAYGEGATFRPLVDALRDVDPTAAGDELVERRIAGLSGAAQEPGSLGESYWAVRRLLEQLARLRPVALFLDDVHWAEPALLDLVEYLRDRVTDAPLFVLCLARPELLDERQGWASTARVLEPLAVEDVRELVTGTAELEEESLERIVELAEGNPLYAQQLATYAAESGKALEPGAMPATIDAVLAGRLGRLDAGERATLQRAAVVGREFSRGAVAALAPPDLAVDAHLLALARRGFVRPLAEPLPGDDAYRFHHVLLRDAAYATLTKEQRADLHEKVAAWLDRDGPGDDAIVGYHLEQVAALRPTPEAAQTAGDRLGRAAYRAAARGDLRATGSLLERAVTLLPSGSRRAELLWELAIHRLVSGRPGAAATLEESASEADRHGDGRVAARVSVARAAWRLDTGDMSPEEALSLTTEALAILEDAEDARGQHRAWMAVGAVHNFRYEMALMGEAAARAEACARGIGFSTSASIGMQADAFLYGPTPAAAAISKCQELLDRTADRAGSANVLVRLSGLHGLIGGFREADDLLDESRAAYAEIGLTLSEHTCWAHAAFAVRRLANRAAEAEAIARASMEALLALGQSAWAATRAVQLADLALDHAQVDDAGKMAALANRHASKYDVLVQFMLLRVQARLKARTGDIAAAERLAKRAVTLSERTDDLSARADTLTALAEVLLLASRPSDAARAAANADALYDAKENIAGRERAHRILGTLQPA